MTCFSVVIKHALVYLRPNPMEKMILVTGGTGLLGSHLLYRLASGHSELTALKRPSSDLKRVKQVFGYYTGSADETDELFGRIRWMDVDLMNRVEMEDAMQGAGRVYHDHIRPVIESGTCES